MGRGRTRHWHSGSLWLIGPGRVFGALELHFEPLGTDLEPVHRGYRRLCGSRVVERHETKALGQVRLFVYEHLGRNHRTERQECGGQIGVGELLWEVINKKITTLGTWKELRQISSFKNKITNVVIKNTTVLRS